MRTATLILVALAFACDSPEAGPTDPGGGPEISAQLTTATEIRVVEGAGQSDSILATLPDPVRVELADPETGDPVPGVSISWHVLDEGCGEPYAGHSVTDADGRAAELWVLGTRAGDCRMEARAVRPDGTPVVYERLTATIEPGQPKAGPRSESERTGEWPRPGRQLVTDQAGNPLDWTIRDPEGEVQISDDGRRLLWTGEDNTVRDGDMSWYWEGEWDRGRATIATDAYGDLQRVNVRSCFGYHDHSRVIEVWTDDAPTPDGCRRRDG